jgi:CheY-like chemotaxis protein
VGPQGNEELTRQAGFDAHLLKPVDIKALEVMLAHYCEESQRERAS